MQNPAQRRQMASIRKLLRSAEWSEVQQGLALLQALNAPQLWRVIERGLSISEGGSLKISSGEVNTRVRAAHRLSVALWVAHRAGWLDELTTLYLYSSPMAVLSDLRPLSQLQGLVSLTIPCCRAILDLTPLSGLTRLEVLDLNCCESLPTLVPLSGLRSVISLTLSCIPTIQDLTPLSGLTRLEVLDLSYCESIRTLAPLRQLPRLRSLDLRCCASLPRSEIEALRVTLPSCSIRS